MAIQTPFSQVEALYIGYFGRAGEPDGVNYWVTQLNSGHYSWAEAAASFSVQPEAIEMYPYLKFPAIENPSAFIDQIYMNLFNREADPEGKAYWTKELLARGNDPQAIGQFILDVINGAFGPEGNPADAETIVNKIDAGTYFTEQLAGIGIGGTHIDASGDVVLDDNLKGPSKDAVKNVTDNPETVQESKDLTDAFIHENPNPGETFTLTTGVDTFVGTAKDDVFNATEAPGHLPTLTASDSLDGGDGIDTLNVVQTNSINTTTIPNLSVKNIEIINMTSGSSVTTNTTAWTGATDLNINAGAGINATAAATTDVNATSAKLDSSTAKVTGGQNVSVTTHGATFGTVEVVNAAGDVDVIHNAAFLNVASAPRGGVTVNGGGQSINVTETSGAAAATKGTINHTVSQGNVSVTGGATTTDVTVTQDEAVGKENGVDGRIGVVNGRVTIKDANAGSATAPGSISTVTLNSFGDGSSINSGALSTVNLSGTGWMLGITAGSLATPVVAALALNVSDLTTTGAITVHGTNYKTLNLDSSGSKSTIHTLTANSATDVNIAGDAAIVLSSQNLGAAKTITSTNTAGVTLGTHLGTGVQFTGGDGDDTISINGATTKAIKMGAGDDMVTINAAPGPGGSIDGGDGTDTLVLNLNGSTFATFVSITNFENLRVSGNVAGGLHEAYGFKGIETGHLNSNTIFNNVGPHVDLTVLEANAARTTTVNVIGANTNPNDVFGLHLKAAEGINAGTIILPHIETVNITSTDTDTSAAGGGYNKHTVKLEADAATTINVSGNAGITFVDNSNHNTRVTTFDASGIQGPADKAAELAVVYTSHNKTPNERVYITGGSGNDILTGSSTANDHINGGDGDDLLIYTGGADVFTGGAGADIFKLEARGAYTDFLTITDAEKSDKINLQSGAVHNGNAQFFETKITLGADSTFLQYVTAAAHGNGSSNSRVSWFEYGEDTYVYVDNSISPLYNPFTDVIIKLSGVVDLSTSTMFNNVLTV